jgi:hypothetical protein
MKSLTICMITARKEPQVNWFIDSLIPQMDNDTTIEFIQVELGREFGSVKHIISENKNSSIRWTAVAPKPSVWQGKYRLTPQDYWDISGAKNTAACLCQTEWIAYIDDRCVLAPTWLSAVKNAIRDNYAVSGSYEKRFGMQVENGKIIHDGEITGIDPRNPRRVMSAPRPTYGGDWYGCTQALPLEWLLEMNGHHETCSSLGLEDVVFGNMLVQNGHPTYYDSRMLIVEDRPRDPGEGMPYRMDKGVSPNDKSHALLEKIGGQKRCDHPIDLRAERERVLKGEPWTIPTQPDHDWYDGQLLKDFP